MKIYRSNILFGNRIKTKGTTFVIGGDIWKCTKVPDTYLINNKEVIWYDSYPTDEEGISNFKLFESKYFHGKEFGKMFRMPEQYSDEHLCICDGELYSCIVIPMTVGDHIRHQSIDIIFRYKDSTNLAILNSISDTVENFIQGEYYMDLDSIIVVKCFIENKLESKYSKMSLGFIRDDLIRKINNRL